MRHYENVIPKQIYYHYHEHHSKFHLLLVYF